MVYIRKVTVVRYMKVTSDVMRFLPTGIPSRNLETLHQMQTNNQFGLQALSRDFLLNVLKNWIKFMLCVVIAVVFSCFSNLFHYANIEFCRK